MYSVVLVGLMNPRLHRPDWYHHVKLIDNKELDFANGSTNTINVREVAQIETDDFILACTSDRWEIKTRKSGLMGRLVKIAEVVFDQHLNHTPIVRLGLNFNWEKTTNAASVDRCIARELAGTRLGLPKGSPTTGKLSLSYPDGQKTVSLEISGVGDPARLNFVSVYNNFNYDFSSMEAEFKLAEFLKNHEDDQRIAERQTSEVVEAINALGCD
jgi:hypothetical protein